MTACVFCEIVEHEVPSPSMVYEWPETIAFVPLNPIVSGHILVVPKQHVRDYVEDAKVSATTMRRAAELMQWLQRPSNLITSSGEAATQTVFHLHLHIVPRAPGDGLALPWTAQQKG